MIDVIVIGGGVNGLAAAASLARAGRKVVLLEARDHTGGYCDTASVGNGFRAPIGAHALFAADPGLISELRLSRKGLRFAWRDMPTVGLRRDGRHIVLTRDMHATTRSIAVHSKSDAEKYPAVHRDLYALARALRPVWWADADVSGLRLSAAQQQLFHTLERMSAAAWLDANFESDALKATLAFDATLGPTSLLASGSALIFAWRAAQEMCGRQGAIAIPEGGAQGFARALSVAATDAGAEIRTNARVTRIEMEGGRVCGVSLATGERLHAPIVIAGTGRRETLCDLVPDAGAGFGAVRELLRAGPSVSSAQIVFLLHRLPDLGGHPAQARYVIADRLESFAAAHASSRQGCIPDELAMELVFPTLAEPGFAPEGQHLASVLVRPVPAFPHEGRYDFAENLKERAASAVQAVIPGFSANMMQGAVFTPEDFATRIGEGATDLVTAPRMLSSWNARIETPVAGLYLCGGDAEPVAAESGRAGRMAARIVTLANLGGRP